MNEWVAAVLFGVIEGVTEFLPISSTGHLLIPQSLGWLPPESDLFNVGIQSGAVLAVLAVFRDRVKEMLVGWRNPATRDYILKLLVAFVITGAGGLLLKQAGLKLPKELAPVAWATLIGGVLFLGVEHWLRGRATTDAVPWRVAWLLGAAQLVAAIFPGASRSGTTILAALALGVSRPAAAEFSFLLGVPTLLAAGGLEAVKALRDASPEPVAWGPFALATAVSAITAFMAVKWLLRFIQTHTFVVFGWYRIVLGGLLLALLR